MGKLGWFKFFPGDWMKDPELRVVSSGARGLWIDMLSLMFECDRRGYLQLNNGKIVTAEHLARMTGNSTDDTSHWLQELEDSGVFSRTEDGTIYSRRQVRDERERGNTRERVGRFRNKDVTVDVTASSVSVSDSSFLVLGSKEEIPPRSDELIERIARAYPGNWRKAGKIQQIPQAQLVAIIAAVARDGPVLVEQGTLAYAEKVKNWPPGERKWVMNACKFYGDEAFYLKDPEEWERRSGLSEKHSKAAATVSSNREILLADANRNRTDSAAGRSGDILPPADPPRRLSGMAKGVSGGAS